jgi:hypothetical protein
MILRKDTKGQNISRRKRRKRRDKREDSDETKSDLIIIILKG